MSATFLKGLTIFVAEIENRDIYEFNKNGDYE